MSQTAPIVLRVVFYGLIGFVPGDKGFVALLPEDKPDDHHKVFVAFVATACTPHCHKLKLTGGYELALDFAESDAMHTARNALSQGALLNGKHLPDNPLEAEWFSWVPVMAKVLSEGEPVDGNCFPGPAAARVHKDCINESVPTNCNPGRGTLAARMQLWPGALKTCALIEHGGIFDLPDIHAFQFKKKGSCQGVKQALSEVVVAEREVDGDEVVFRYYPFKNKSAISELTLKPYECGDRRCIDIVVTNMPPGDRDHGPLYREVGHDFSFLYGLLDKPPTKELIPHKTKTQITAKEVRPVCDSKKRKILSGAFPSLPIRERLLRAHQHKQLRRAFLRNFGFTPLSPDTRPICPMATLEPPA